MNLQWASPWLDESERNEMIAAFDSTWLSMGPRTKEFEQRMSAYLGVKHAIAVSNGTDALDLALKALDVKCGDEVIIPAMTYIATVNSVLYQNALPVFADIERETYNIDPEAIRRLISNKTKCIMYIDYGGNPADYKGLKKISCEYGIPLLQDGAQSLGAEFDGSKLCKQGLISTTSFHTAKLITTIEGGMIFTDVDEIDEKIRIMRNQGEDIARKYIHVMIGTNSRMTDIQAAIGLRQIDKLDRIIKKRREIADSYYKYFSTTNLITIPTVREKSLASWFFAPILVENRDSIIQDLNSVGIATRIAYPMPIYEQPFFAKYRQNHLKYDCPNAKWMTERVINLPMFHAMNQEQIQYIISNVLEIVKKNAK